MKITITLRLRACLKTSPYCLPPNSETSKSTVNKIDKAYKKILSEDAIFVSLFSNIGYLLSILWSLEFLPFLQKVNDQNDIHNKRGKAYNDRGGFGYFTENLNINMNWSTGE